MPDGWHFTDVWGLDPEVLSFVQGPVKAVMLLYPITEKVFCQGIANVSKGSGDSQARRSDFNAAFRNLIMILGPLNFSGIPIRSRKAALTSLIMVPLNFKRYEYHDPSLSRQK